MITSQELRQAYLDFFVEKGHALIPSASLVPENDPTTLFTSSGMQPLVPYLLGQPHPKGTRIVDSQKSFRSQDIEEVGDNRHTTFFEMLGNWSLGDYFKKEQLAWFYEFLTKVVKLPADRLFVTVFEGNNEVPRDEESAQIWQKLGIPKERIFYYPAKKNWWSRSGEPSMMPPGEPGGPDSEVFFEFNEIHHDPKFGDTCHPNCDCGRFMEIGNSVFMQYQKQADGSLKELSQKNVDFGGGLERILAAINNDPDIFKTDLFTAIIDTIESATSKKYTDTQYTGAMRIISDHLKAATFLIDAGITPSNKTQGYVLRRLIRRSVVKLHQLGVGESAAKVGADVVTAVGQTYQDVYLDINTPEFNLIKNILIDEIDKFEHTLKKGLKIFEKTPVVTGKVAFDLLQTYGFPWELTLELAAERGQQVNKAEFETEFKKHQDLSRTASKGLFRGGLADHSVETTKLHTATHLIHQALRHTLGTHVHQEGSNITVERLRFDFSHPTSITPEQITTIETEVNQQIQANLPVTKTIENKEAALKSGAMAFFREKYPDEVSVYTIGDPKSFYSKELCGGPHVTHTGEIGGIKITKQESIGAGKRRLYAVLDMK
jgi:alanyl-tRNA synthetase